MTMEWQEQPDAWERSLAECEAVITRGQETFVEVGRALLEIRDRQLYKDGWRTFEAYCQERWEWEQSNALNYIAAAEVVTNLQTFEGQPKTFGQALALAPLTPTKQLSLPAQRKASSSIHSPEAGQHAPSHANSADASWAVIFNHE